MPQLDLVIRGRRVVLSNSLVPASIHVRAGRISAIKAFEDIAADCGVVEAGKDSVVMPGLVDSHVHINEPGRTEWEGFATATRAAAAGGVTTIVDMPLNCMRSGAAWFLVILVNWQSSGMPAWSASSVSWFIPE